MDKVCRYSVKDYRRLPDLDQALTVLAKQLSEDQIRRRQIEEEKKKQEALKAKTPAEMIELCNERIRELTVTP